jgi:hypothetical protein
MIETKKLTYTIGIEDPAPLPGQYFVMMSHDQKRGILSVSLIKSVVAVKHKIVTDEQGYHLRLIPCPELKELTDFQYHNHGADVWVKGEPALPSFWHRRDGK